MNFVAEIITVSRAQPTSIQVAGDYVTMCCALHTEVQCNVDGGLGCAGWKHGSHKAIAALYSRTSDNHYCGTMEGQRVLDQRLAREAVDIKRPEISLFGGGLSYVRKMTGGYPASVSSYGAGYCYLLPFLPTARGRVARILGPLPLVVDVLRLFRIVGDPNATPSDWSCVGPNTFHIEKRGGQPARRNAEEFMRIGLNILQSLGFDARVGAENLSSSSSSGSVQAVPSYLVGVRPIRGIEGSGLVSWFGTVRSPVTLAVRTEFVSSERMLSLANWLFGKGVDLDTDGLFDAGLATCAVAALPTVLPRIKDRYKTWALHGDHAVKVVQSALCVSRDLDVSEYTSLSGFATNQRMADIVFASGLNTVADIGGLSPTSRAVATMLEALIGVVALRADSSQLVRFLSAVGLLPVAELPDRCAQISMEVSDFPVVDSLGGLLFGLDSNEYEIAIQLKKLGRLHL